MDFQAFIVQGCLACCLALTISPPPYPQQQGIEGIARRISGNRMPSPRYHSGPPAGAHATICVFGLTNENQVSNSGSAGLYSAVRTKLIRQVDTDDSGHFRILLPSGTYSVFTRKGRLFYATRRDEKNNIAPVEVLPGKMTWVECSVESDHPAAY